MSVKSFIVNLLIAAIIMVQYKSYGLDSDQEAKDYAKELEMAKTYKDDICFARVLPGCGGSLTPSPDNKLMKWYYAANTKTCDPVYMPNVSNITCPEIDNLIETKKECEDYCGDPCLITYASMLTEPGICMHDYDCHISPVAGVPKPCPENVNCCPRNYKLPTTTPVPMKTKQP